MVEKKFSTYIATFTSHYGALAYARLCKQQDFDVHIVPTPRGLKHCCSTCVNYFAPRALPTSNIPHGVEYIVRINNEGYETIYQTD